MKTTFQLMDIVWARIDSSPLKMAISGGIYRRRPIGSAKEDVVINSLPVNNEQLQQGVLNVNIHVPNLQIENGALQDHNELDYNRLHELASMAISILDDVWEQEYHFEVASQTVIEDETDHYVNLRLNFFNINISN